MLKKNPNKQQQQNKNKAAQNKTPSTLSRIQLKDNFCYFLLWCVWLRDFFPNFQGEFDDNTLALLNRPRCGNPDKYTDEPYFRGRRYAATSGWGRAKITWNAVNYTEDLTTEQVDEALTEAFKVNLSHMSKYDQLSLITDVGYRVSGFNF